MLQEKKIKKRSPNWPHIPDRSYIALIICNSELGKTNALLNLINHQPDIHKIYLYAKQTHVKVKA